MAEIEAATPVAEDRRDAYAKARKRLEEISRDDVALHALLRKHADALATIAGKHADKEPEASDGALRAALLLVADHARATALVGKKPAESGGGRATPLFDGKTTAGWEGVSPDWRVEGGSLVGDLPTLGKMLLSQKTFSGDFAVVMEARLVEAYPKNGQPYFGIKAARTGQAQETEFGVHVGSITLQEEDGPGAVQELFDEPAESLGVDPTNWNTFELRFEADSLRALLNGKELVHVKRSSQRKGGNIGIQCQFCKVLFRRIEVRRL